MDNYIRSLFGLLGVDNCISNHTLKAFFKKSLKLISHLANGTSRFVWLISCYIAKLILCLHCLSCIGKPVLCFVLILKHPSWYILDLTQDYKSFPLQSVVLISANVCDAMRSIKLFPTKFLLIAIAISNDVIPSKNQALYEYFQYVVNN